MPRRKTGFIDRSRAQTYQLFHTSGGEGSTEKHIFVPINEAAASQSRDPSSASLSKDATGNESGIRDAIDGSQWDKEYNGREFELGEYGFPDDGYDYSQHFKVIGGGGGVFMDAFTGKQNPDAVPGSSIKRDQGVARGKGSILLRDDAEQVQEEFPSDSWKMKSDVDHAQIAIEEIKAERKRNMDLDEVFAVLDSEGELDSSSQREGGQDAESADELFLDSELNDSKDVLEDDFISMAQHIDEGVAVKAKPLEGIVKEYREPRLLDEQFEKFMQAHTLASSDEDDQSEEFFLDANNADQRDEIQAHLTNQELENLFEGEEGLLNDLSGLQIAEGPEANAAASGGIEPSESTGNDDETEFGRAVEYEDIANAEFERGMTGLLDSFNRVSMEEVLGSKQGVGKAFEALERNELEEVAKIDKRIEDGMDEESDGHDSELDTKFDEMYADPGEKWDCETIISTYSNLENHPSVIDAPSSIKRRPAAKPRVIRLDPRTQAPEGYMPTDGTDPSQLVHMDFGSSRREVAQKTQARNREESKEEKRARKTAAKEAARERRALKSEMKKAFGSENVKQNRHATAIGTSKVAMKF